MTSFLCKRLLVFQSLGLARDNGGGQCGSSWFHLCCWPLRRLTSTGNFESVFNPKETFSQHNPSRLIFRTPCQRRTKWSSQSTQEQVDKFPDRDQHYLSETYIISKGMPEFAKSEFSVIRLHEVNIMTFGSFLFTPSIEKKSIPGVMLWQSCKQDFIWLHDVIQENLQYAGFIIPPKVLLLFLVWKL